MEVLLMRKTGKVVRIWIYMIVMIVMQIVMMRMWISRQEKSYHWLCLAIERNYVIVRSSKTEISRWYYKCLTTLGISLQIQGQPIGSCLNFVLPVSRDMAKRYFYIGAYRAAIQLSYPIYADLFLLCFTPMGFQ